MANEYQVGTIAAEALTNNPGDARMGAIAAEVLLDPVGTAQIGVIGLEVLRSIAEEPSGGTGSRRRMSFM